ncbi:5'-nucleotidase C-terminal domain-containing protein [Psychrobacillus sp. PGGUH221]|uniref:bifunctional metallophosphatase/5'-nucleotidase n=1 Tax=Psychrobacillus sp. PGGUH221 TaxID=3020058 RepID=UPI0035C722F1
MKKNTIKKSVIATVLATTLLTSTNVGYANTTLEELVNQARTDLKVAKNNNGGSNNGGNNNGGNNNGGSNNGGNNNGGSNNGGNNNGGGNNGGGNNTTFELSLMHTNDTHAKVETATKRITAIKEFRKQKPNALLIDAGDVFSGTLYFNEYKGQADLEFMNLAGYDLMTFGNHEFDLGSTPEGHQALADFIKGAKFSFVSANVDFSADDKFRGLFSDLISSKPKDREIYNGIVKEINGQKVGFFGLTTAETKGLSSPGKVTFSNYMEEAEKAVKAFEKMGVNKIVAVTHIGYDDNPEVDNDLSLAAHVDGIDVIIGGHSHTKLDAPVIIDKDEKGVAKDKTIIVQASSQGDYLGTLNIEFDKKGKIVGQDGKLIEVGKLAEDPEAKTILGKYKPRVDEIAKTEIGVSTDVVLENPRTNGDNTKPSVRKNETILGNLIADGMLAKAKSINPKVIMAFQNGGGIRSEIGVGPITVGEVITVLPFGNTLSTMEITGAELKQAFETSFGVYPLENGGFLHVAGAKVEFDSSKPKGERVVSISYEKGKGEYVEIQDNETYTVATNYFTAQGGDNYTVFKKLYDAGKVNDLGLSDWENFREHLKSLEKIPTKIEGRIVDIKDRVKEPIAAEDFSGTVETPKVYEGDVTVIVTDAEKLENAIINGNLILIGTPKETLSISNVKVTGNVDLSVIEGINFDLEDLTVDGEMIL